MKTANNLLAISSGLLGAVAFYGAAFCNAPWHYATTICCVLLTIVFSANASTPKRPGTSGR